MDILPPIVYQLNHLNVKVVEKTPKELKRHGMFFRKDKTTINERIDQIVLLMYRSLNLIHLITDIQITENVNSIMISWRTPKYY